jgi:hypothetical protein
MLTIFVIQVDSDSDRLADALSQLLYNGTQYDTRPRVETMPRVEERKGVELAM